MAAAEPDTQAIFESISSVTSSPSTILALQQLLGILPTINASERPSKATVSSRTAPLASRAHGGGRTNTKSSRTNTQVSIHTEATKTLSKHERLVFATKIINIGLKTISSSAKKPDVPAAARTEAPPAARPATQARARALTNKSPNSPGKRVNCQKVPISKTSSSLQPSNIAIVAECSRLALCYVRANGKQPSAGTLDLALETGSLSFIGKCLALGLDSIVLKELRMMKMRLDKVVEPASTIQKPVRKVAIESVKALLECGSLENLDGATISIFIKYQIYVVRAILRSLIHEDIEFVLKYLDLRNISSPLSLLLRQSKRNQDPANHIRQLESFLSALLAACPSVAPDADIEACDKPRAITPPAVLRIHAIVWHYRAQIATLDRRKFDPGKDFWRPLSRCFAAFARRSSMAASQQYVLAKDVFVQLNETIEKAEITSEAQSIASDFQSQILFQLSSLAQAAGAFDDAITWTSKHHNEEDDKEQEGTAQVAIRTLRMATLSLQTSTKLDISKQMIQAHSCMVKFLKGDSHELDLLLLEVAGYRKSLMARILSNSDDALPDSQSQLCQFGIFACARFLLRYVGKSMSEDDHDCRHKARQEEKFERASKVAPSLIDSVLHCCKMMVKSKNSIWPDLDTALDDCLQLVCILEKPGSRHSRAKIALKASTLYLAIYKQENHLNEPVTPTAIQALKRSISVLAAEDGETRELGQYMQKLEQLMHLHQASQDFDAAYKCIVQVMQHFQDQGYLDQLTGFAANLSYDQLWQSENGLVVGRVLDDLDVLSQRAVRSEHKSLCFYGFEHTSMISALLLERQLMRASETLLKPGGVRSRQQLDNVSHALSALFEVYDQQAYPIRRHRNVAICMKFKAAFSSYFDDKFADVVEEIIPEGPTVDSSKDRGLICFRDHWHYTNELGRALSRNDFSMSTADEAINFWSQTCQEGTKVTASIDNMSALVDLLRVLSKLCDIKQDIRSRSKVLHLLELLLVQHNVPDYNAIADTISELASHYLQAGQTVAAELCLVKFKNLSSNTTLTPERLSTHHLLQAQYLLSQGMSNNCYNALQMAGNLAEREITVVQSGQSTRGSIIRMNSWLAHALEVSSCLKFSQGHSVDALKDAKWCIKLLQRSWASLENDGIDYAHIQDSDISDFKKMDGFSAQGGAVTKSLTHEALKGAKLWYLIPALVRNYHRLSTIYRHHGMFAESLYWLDNAQKICTTIDPTASQSLNASLLAELHLNNGQMELSQKFLDEAKEALRDQQPCGSVIETHRVMARIWRAREDPEKEIEACDAALQALRVLDEESMPVGAANLKSVEDKLVADFTTMRIKEDQPDAKPTRASRTKDVRKTTSMKPRQPTRKVGTAKPMHCQEERHSPNSKCSFLQAELMIDKTAALMRNHDLQGAAVTISGINDPITNEQTQQCCSLVSTRLDISRLLKNIISDCSLAMLPESTIAIPALESGENDGDPLVNTVKEIVRSTGRSVKTNTTRKLMKTNRSKSSQNSMSDVKIDMCRIRNQLQELQRVALRLSSVAEYGHTCSLLTTVSAYVSAAMQSQDSALVNPSSAAMSIDRPNIFARQMTAAASKAGDRSISREEMYTWPSVALSHDTRPGQLATMSPEQFQELYIDILPEPWTTISLQLSETKEDLFIARYRRGESPFVLRVPITPQSHDPLEDAFSYEDGKAELLKIIADSHDSTHNAKYVDSSAAKKEWWALRESLDTRIHELLLNIEKIWFGGFRGILSSKRTQPLQIAKLKREIMAGLDRHLPSRQSKKQRKNVEFDSRIWEIFVGLGDPSDDSVDIDESLVDLLYFVVDVLQFNGETNAYDEIDFDALAIDVLDALKAYYGALTETDCESDSHMILILDKDLHMFPWESLPCLAGSNVSRLPSLEDLRLRILAMKPAISPTTKSKLGHHVMRSTGASLLNPSGDLTGTEAVIRPLLSGISGNWTHAATAPTDKELSVTLSQSSLFLYFGHGSGNQFITNKTVRGLSSCPTTWLMGCSSAALKCHGTAFQPSGMVLSYLAAGAPAVVGTLWDVTDKDCDRASVRMGEAWGLWRTKGQHKLLALKGRQTSVAETEKTRGARAFGGRSKGGAGGGNSNQTARSRARGNDSPHEKSRNVSLVEAVRLGRDECYLRYLNGAALVVYGIPVFLDG